MDIDRVVTYLFIAHAKAASFVWRKTKMCTIEIDKRLARLFVFNERGELTNYMTTPDIHIKRAPNQLMKKTRQKNSRLFR